jgi:hypothetical protein
MGINGYEIWRHIENIHFHSSAYAYPENESFGYMKTRPYILLIFVVLNLMRFAARQGRLSTIFQNR